MDMRKIGGFLKALRKDKGLTQEQLAEILLVSGKTVSRWETGTNLPDLSVLIQIAALYGVEVKEILDGERQGQPIDPALRETLDRVADYSRLEKEQIVKTGQAAFVISFTVCAASIAVQLMLGGGLPDVLGETVTLFAGGIAYIVMMLYHGLGAPDTPARDILTGALSSGAMTLVLIVRAIRSGMAPSRIIRGAVLFYLGIMSLGLALMKILSFIQQKRKKRP